MRSYDQVTHDIYISTLHKFWPRGPLAGTGHLGNVKAFSDAPLCQSLPQAGMAGAGSAAVLFWVPCLFLGQKMNENPPSMEPNKWEHGTLRILQAMLDQTGRCSGYFGLRTRRGLLNHIYCPQIPAANVEHIFFEPPKSKWLIIIVSSASQFSQILMVHRFIHVDPKKNDGSSLFSPSKKHNFFLP